jgi:hypothetical protein
MFRFSGPFNVSPNRPRDTEKYSEADRCIIGVISITTTQQMPRIVAIIRMFRRRRKTARARSW